ncbi:Common central domain of tyrosinase [Rhizobiales bacterium GAS113]|nr:Common central domain of tyrosinase [Rhizobiales bacterium GAS113]
MTPSRYFLSAAILVSGLAAADTAKAAACAGGGSLTVTASSDSLTLLPVAATTFNFGEHVILTAAPSGFSIASYSWTIDGPTIKDYNEDLGTKNMPTPAAALPWSTTPLAPADLTAASVGFYFVPSAAQFEPNNGPFTRNVTLDVTKSGGGSCSVTTPYMVERNETDITRQAEDFYTSNHRPATTTNPLFGHVVDEHIFWHQTVHDSPSFPIWTRFLAWHGEFVRRFDLWRQEFGYKKVLPWYPGRPLPTGPQFDADAGLRIAYVADANHIPTYYTISGGTIADGGGQHKLADYASLDDFTNSFEGGFHGQVHCNIGVFIPGTFFSTSGPGYGSMCNASSPKDTMFWRWHGFIDTLYRNYCSFHPASCPIPSPADPSADPWMADNATDIADNGTVPSPGTHWISPDVWNRRTQVTTDACVQPVDTYGDHVTSGGVVRDCGSAADHENPVSGVTNYLYGTLRNTRPESPRVVYAEVGVYYALASSGLTYPADFTMVPEQRQFITLFLEPGTTTSIGPIAWVPPPVPPANDHYCLYMRVLSVQATPPVEGLGIDTDVANNNDLAWRNIKVVAPGDMSPPSFFIVRNIGKERERLSLRFEVAPALADARTDIHVTLDKALTGAFRTGGGKLDGLKPDGKGGFLITSAKATIDGLLMVPREVGHVKVLIGPRKPSVWGDITITQMSPNGVDGGVTLHLATKK